VFLLGHVDQMFDELPVSSKNFVDPSFECECLQVEASIPLESPDQKTQIFSSPNHSLIVVFAGIPLESPYQKTRVFSSPNRSLAVVS
jgi:hypothetical protein